MFFLNRVTLDKKVQLLYKSIFGLLSSNSTIHADLQRQRLSGSDLNERGATSSARKSPGYYFKYLFAPAMRRKGRANAAPSKVFELPEMKICWPVNASACSINLLPSVPSLLLTTKHSSVWLVELNKAKERLTSIDWVVRTESSNRRKVLHFFSNFGASLVEIYG